MAQAREKSPALRGIDAELQKCPWGKKVKPVVNTQEGARESVQYDGENYRIAVGDRVFPPEEIPQKYAFSATQAYRQQLFRLFSADTPVDQNTYTNVQVENLVAAHRAEIKVAAETNPGKPVMFISEDGTKVDLRTKSDEDIGKLLRGQKFLQRFWQDSFAAYSKKYGEFKQKLIAEGNLVEGY